MPTLSPYNLDAYNDYVYNLGENLVPNVSLRFDGVDQYLENTIRQAQGIANLWTITLWMKPLETPTKFDEEGRQLFRPDGKALLHLKGATHRNEVLIWGERIENPNSEEFIIVENWDDSTQRIRVTRFNLAQKQREWRLFSCAWNSNNLIAWSNGVELPDISETLSGTGSFIMTDLDRGGGGRSTRLAAAYSGTATSLGEPRLVAYSGLMGPVGVWDEVLEQTEIAEVASGTFGFDLTTNSGTYSSSANLQHWWRLGAASSGVGFDYVETGRIDVGDNATISGPNVVADFP